ncbi:hypothetical protein LPTSP3_g14930 [Leptospira kobayashii]|uniref:Amidohydrolase-related domain-containing protein n=1 Tax=Leptospira kobayashii TaxID=1917830 RepID=A0ABN6KCC7_9LEPT|nr:hypothetical protein LPTSP3_g14930 [Leptospira kobayashii]
MYRLVLMLMLLVTSLTHGCSVFTNLLSGGISTAKLQKASLVIENVTIVDPRTGSKKISQSIVISDGRIESVGSTLIQKPNKTYKRINAQGLFAVPGFNNMHSHALQAENSPAVLLLMLAEGVTGFRQMAGSTELLSQRAAGELPLTEKAPALLAMPAEPIIPISASTKDELSELMQRQKKDGADFIKVGWMSPSLFYEAIVESQKLGIPIVGHVPEGVDPTRAEFANFRTIEHLGPGDVIWIACSSQKAILLSESIDKPTRILPNFKLPNFATPIIQSLIAGKMKRFLINPVLEDSPARVSRLQKALTSFDRNKCNALAEQFVQNDNWMVPTLVRLRTQYFQNDPEYQKDKSIQFIAPHAYKEWLSVLNDFNRISTERKLIYKETYESQKVLTKLFSDAKVPMMTGTDGSGQAPGLSLQQEFKELAAAGISPLQILQMTTIQPARFLKKTSTMGLIAKGMNADIVLLAADPTSKVENLGTISGVIRAGNYHSKSDFDTYKKTIAESSDKNINL